MSSVIRWSRFAFNVVAWIFVGCVAIQFYLAGQAVFGNNNYSNHQNFGYLFGLLTLVMIALAALGRTGWRLIGASALLLVLFALQSVFVAMRGSNDVVAALHPLNGFLIGLLSLWIAWRTRGYLRTPTEGPTGPTAL